LTKFATENNGFDLWTDAKPNVRSTDIMAPPHRIDDLVNFLKTQGISYSTMIDNVET